MPGEDATLINITITVDGSASGVASAAAAALQQTYARCTVTVVDDSSDSATRKALDPLLAHPRLCYIRLAEPAGRPRARNLSLLLSRFDAITFHRAGDLPDPNKVLLQERALSGSASVAREDLDWVSIGHAVGAPLAADIVLSIYELMSDEGGVRLVNGTLSLLEDFFPNVQRPDIHMDRLDVDHALFRRNVFEEVGGFRDSTAADREMRNRLLAAGYVFHLVDRPLLIRATESSQEYRSNRYSTESRVQKDLAEVWRQKNEYMTRGFGESVRLAPVRADVSGVEIVEVSNPTLLAIHEQIPATDASHQMISDAMDEIFARRMLSESR